MSDSMAKAESKLQMKLNKERNQFLKRQKRANERAAFEGRNNLTTPFTPASDLSRFFVVRKKGRFVTAEFFDSDQAASHAEKLNKKVGGRGESFIVQPLAWVLANCEA